MIVFIESDGTVASVVSSPFYQGSSLSGAFHLVAPYPQNYSASVRFILADGRYTEFYPMTPVSELPNALSGLAENVTVYEIASKTGEITAKSGTVTAQFTITYNGEVQMTASVNFTVNVGVPSLPSEQTQPTDDEWLRLLEVITQLSNKLPANGGMDFTVDIVTVNGAVYYRYTKTYANGTTAEIDVPVITDDGAVMQSGMTKVDIPRSAWEGSSAPYTFTIESGIPDGMFVAELMEKTTNGYATRADSIEYNADGSMTIKSNSKYQGMLVFTNNAIFNNAVKKTGDTMTGNLTINVSGATPLILKRENSIVNFGLRKDSNSVYTPRVWRTENSKSIGLAIHPDGLYETTQDGDARVYSEHYPPPNTGGGGSGGSKMYKHTLSFPVVVECPDASDFSGSGAYTVEVFNDSSTAITNYGKAIDYIPQIVKINSSNPNVGHYLITGVYYNYADMGYMNFNGTQLDSSGYWNVQITFDTNFTDTVTEV